MVTGPDSSVATPSAKQTGTGPAASLWTGKRLYIALFLFLNLFINYMDRVNLSVAAPDIARRFNWDPGTMGLVFSAYMWTYCFCLTPWGWLADRYGTRKVSATSVMLFSAAHMLTGACVGFGTMVFSRMALGVGEAASMPAAGKVVRQWFPARERGLATAIFNGGTFAGPAISAPVIAWLILRTGWRMSFVITGVLGLVWVFFWLKWFRVPSECSWLPEEERNYILANNGESTQSPRPVKGALLRLISRKTMWGLLLTQGCCAYTMTLYLLWLPSYLVGARHMQLMAASWFTAAPYLVATVLGIPIGKLSDSLITPETARQGTRRKLLIVFILLSSVVMLTNFFDNMWALMALLCVSLTCISSALTLNIAMTSDLVWNSNMAGSALGISILGGISFGLVAPIVTGFIVKWTGNFDNAFYVAGGLLFLGALISFTMTRRPLDFPDSLPDSGAAHA